MSDLLKEMMNKKSWAKSSTWPTQVIPWIAPNANIKVIWVWWAWWNAINRMVSAWVNWVEFIAMNTDSQALSASLAEKKITIWKAATRWLWAWWNPENWKTAAEESREEIKSILNWADMVFVTCGLWGWTWTWAAPVVAEVAREMWILTIWVVTKPFSFEWQRRWKQAVWWYEELKQNVDTLITIPNDRILSIIDKQTPLTEAFMVVDDVLRQWIAWVSEVITWNWLINVDFADVKSVMYNAWSALMWIWYWSWENRASDAAKWAIDSPLLELSVNWAKWVLINVTWWSDLSMFEVDEAAKIVTEAVDPEANIIFWAVIDEKYSWEVKVTVIATWFSEETQSVSKPKITPAMERMWMWRNSNRQNEQQDDLDVPAFIRKAVK